MYLQLCGVPIACKCLFKNVFSESVSISTNFALTELQKNWIEKYIPVNN